MNKYFLVPVTAKVIKYDGFSLSEILERINIELYERKVYANALKNDETATLEEIENVNKTVQEKFKNYGLHEKIIVVKRDDSLFEIGTELPLEVKNDSYLKEFNVDSDTVMDYFVDNENYCEEVCKFFTEFIKNLEFIKK